MTSDFLENFGDAVRRLRLQRGLTQADLADRVGLGRTSVTNLEKGQQNPPLSLVPEIASALGVDLLHLVAVAVGASDDRTADALTTQVHDEDLRRWAGQVIADTSTGQSQTARAQQSRRRRST